MKQSKETGNKLVDRGWEKMSRSLNDELPQKAEYGSNIWSLIWLFGLIFILVGICWYGIRMDNGVYVEQGKYIANNDSEIRVEEARHLVNADEDVVDALENGNNHILPVEMKEFTTGVSDGMRETFERSEKIVESSDNVESLRNTRGIDEPFVSSKEIGIDVDMRTPSLQFVEDDSKLETNIALPELDRSYLISNIRLSFIPISNIKILEREVYMPDAILSKETPLFQSRRIAKIGYSKGHDFSGARLSLGIMKSVGYRSGFGVSVGLDAYNFSSDLAESGRDGNETVLHNFGLIPYEEFNKYLSKAIFLSFGTQYFHSVTRRTLFNIGVGIKQNIHSDFNNFDQVFNSAEEGGDTEIGTNGIVAMDPIQARISNKTIPFLTVGLDYTVYKDWNVLFGYSYHLKEMYDLVENPKSMNSFNLGISKKF